MRVVRFRSVRRVAALLLALTAAAPALAAGIVRSQVGVALPPGRSVVSPYLIPERGEWVLHVQPLQAAQPESLIDARTGGAWDGALGALLRDGQRLGTESIARVADAADTAPDLVLLRALGCTPRHIVCTSPLDADGVLLIAPEEGGRARLTVVDLRPLLDDMDAVLSGRRAGADLDWGDDEWRALAAAAQRPETRARWRDALRSVRDGAAFERVVASATTGPRLGSRPMFSGADAAVDLAGELEVRGHRLLIGTRADALLAGDAAARGRLADALEAATQPPNPIGVAAHLVDELSARAPDQRRQLAQAIGDEAGRRRSEVLYCFAQWLLDSACGAAAPPWARAEPSPASSPPASATAAAVARPPRTPPPGTADAPLPRPTTPTTSGPAGGDAPHEWTLIQAVPNKLALVAFNEASGRMQPDRAVVGGFSFVARALGPVQDGRFEVEAAAAARAPVPLRYGQYRVRVRLVLDYTREDQCVQGMACWFSRPELHAKSVPRELVFTLTAAGGYADRRRVDFGTLLPLAAGDGARYRSALKEARLAVESVRFELL